MDDDEIASGCIQHRAIQVIVRFTVRSDAPTWVY